MLQYFCVLIKPKNWFSLFPDFKAVSICNSVEFSFITIEFRTYFLKSLYMHFAKKDG